MSNSRQPARFQISSACIVTIRREGQVQAFQVRVNGGGPGLTKYFSVRTHGGKRKAMRSARAQLEALGVPARRRRGGSQLGRLTARSVSGAAGIRFVWIDRALGTPVVGVAVSWVDPDGRPRQTVRRTDSNGDAPAIDLAIQRRVAAGDDGLDRNQLLSRLRAFRRAGCSA